ncbi:MAG: neutral zinc metallopeptidase [Verrucomicrobiales bacterium]
MDPTATQFPTLFRNHSPFQYYALGRTPPKLERRRSPRKPLAENGDGRRVGIVGIIVIFAIAHFTGIDVSQLLQTRGGGGGMEFDMGSAEVAMGGDLTPEQQKMGEFVSVVLADTEDVWNAEFAAHGEDYPEPKMVLFTGQVSSACGHASAAMGPFYCPGDSKVYIDLSFYDDLQRKFGAPGDFAQAYVIAHEVGHHVQNLLGYSDQVHKLRGRVSETEYNKASVRLELQADYLAGVWASHARKKGLLDRGDIEEAVRCAKEIGDDRLQKKAQGYVVPDSFTHGTSEQRVRWFRRGFESGDFEAAKELFELPYEQL